MQRTAGRALAIPLMLGIAGCGTTINERSVFQSVDQSNQIAYYRVKVHGDTMSAQTTYRSGRYDADAVDALFGEVSDGDSSTAKILSRKRAAALEAAAQNYYGLLSKPAAEVTAEDLLKARNRLSTALTPSADISGHDGVLGDGGQRLKQVLMLNAKVSEIEKAISDFVKDKDTSDTLMAAVAASKRGAFIKTATSQADLKQASDALAQIHTTADGTPIDDKTPPATITSWYSSVAMMRVP